MQSIQGRQTPKRIIQIMNLELFSVKLFVIDISSIHAHFCVYPFTLHFTPIFTFVSCFDNGIKQVGKRFITFLVTSHTSNRHYEWMARIIHSSLYRIVQRVSCFGFELKGNNANVRRENY